MTTQKNKHPKLSFLLQTFTCFFFTEFALASSSLSTEFELDIPLTAESAMIEQKWQTIENKKINKTWKIADQFIESHDGVKVKLLGGVMTVQALLDIPKIQDQNILIHSQELNAQIHLSSVSVDQIITKTVGGVSGAFRIQVLCPDILLKLPSGKSGFSIIMKPELKSQNLVVNSSQLKMKSDEVIQKVGLNIQDFDLFWKSQAWEIADFQCQGTAGFEEILKQEIYKILSNSQTFLAPYKSLILSQLQQELSLWDKEIPQSFILFSQRSDIVSKVKFDLIEQSPAGLKGHGFLRVDFLNSQINEQKKLNLEEQRSTDLASGVNLRLPSAFLKEALKFAFEKETWSYRQPGQKISGFQNLMQSRFMQFFVWPELMRYPKSSPFYFDFYSKENPQILGHGLKLQVKEILQSQMLAYRNQSYVPFMDFKVPILTTVQFSIKNGVGFIQIKNSKLKLDAVWNSQYLNKYAPYTHFSSNTIRNHIQDSLQSYKLQINLPALNLIDGLPLQMKKIEEGPDHDLNLSF